MRPLLIVLAMMLCGHTPAEGQQEAADDPLQGCYRLTHGPWRDGPPTPPRGLPPTAFRLLGELEPRRASSGRLMRRVLPGDSNTLSPPHWERVAADSVAVIWGGWPVGMSLRMRIAGDSLVGRVVTWRDDISLDADGREIRPSAEAAAVRIPCVQSSPANP